MKPGGRDVLRLTPATDRELASSPQAEHSPLVALPACFCLLTLFVTQHGFLFSPTCALTGMLPLLCLETLRQDAQYRGTLCSFSVRASPWPMINPPRLVYEQPLSQATISALEV